MPERLSRMMKKKGRSAWNLRACEKISPDGGMQPPPSLSAILSRLVDDVAQYGRAFPHAAGSGAE